jgi:hypothetical protein
MYSLEANILIVGILEVSLEVNILEIDILEVNILEVDILEVNILTVGILELDILEVNILEVNILRLQVTFYFRRLRYSNQTLQRHFINSLFKSFHCRVGSTRENTISTPIPLCSKLITVSRFFRCRWRFVITIRMIFFYKRNVL